MSGVPSGPANPGGINNSLNDPSGAGNASKVPTAPGTNSAGTTISTGSGSTGSATSSSSATSAGRSSDSLTTGYASGRPSGSAKERIDGTITHSPERPGDVETKAEDYAVDKKIKSICRGC